MLRLENYGVEPVWQLDNKSEWTNQIISLLETANALN